MAPPSEILIVIHYHGQIAYNPIQGLMYSCVNPIFLYVSRSITLTQLIRKINNRIPTRATETVVQLLYRVPISFHHGQTHFISRQIHDNDDLRRMLETIVQNAQLKFVELYVVTDLIPQPQPPSPQPSCPQLQLLSPQQLLYNNLDLNDPMSSYNNLETQEVFDIYTSYTQLLSQNDSYFDAQETSFDKKNYHPSQYFTSPLSQQPQTQTSNQNEHLITNEDLIIRFHEENMDDFSEPKDKESFHHNNDQSDDQSNDEGVVIPTLPPLQYHQLRCPVELNLNHLSQYIDQHHFVQQQDSVQPPTGALEVGIDEILPPKGIG
ncbi:hypothetical protein HKD37_13G035439 [Glycine soja]